MCPSRSPRRKSPKQPGAADDPSPGPSAPGRPSLETPASPDPTRPPPIPDPDPNDSEASVGGSAQGATSASVPGAAPTSADRSAGAVPTSDAPLSAAELRAAIAALTAKVADLTEFARKSDTILQDHHKVLDTIWTERQEFINRQGGQPSAQIAPSVTPGAPRPGAPAGGTQGIEGLSKVMDLAGKYLGDGQAAPVADSFQQRLAEASLNRLMSETRLTDSITSAVAEGLKGRVKQVIGGTLPTFQ